MFALVLPNAAHVKNVRGRKTDVKALSGLSDLLAHGLMRGSFVPPAPIEELRALTRTRKQLRREKSSHAQRVDKVLQQANIELGLVLTDLQGKSARAILEAIVAGQTAVDKLAALADKRVRASRHRLREALRGHVAAAWKTGKTAAEDREDAAEDGEDAAA